MGTWLGGICLRAVVVMRSNRVLLFELSFLSFLLSEGSISEYISRNWLAIIYNTPAYEPFTLLRFVGQDWISVYGIPLHVPGSIVWESRLRYQVVALESQDATAAQQWNIFVSTRYECTCS